LDEETGYSLTVYIHWPELSSYESNAEYRRSIKDFETDAHNGELPAYSFIEPRITSCDTTNPSNDQHPRQDIRLGENFINRIYSALVKSPQWERTLLVITYDEHGGIYDHVFPPGDVPAPGPPAAPPSVLPPPVPLPKDPKPVPFSPFDFTRLGVRVPAVIVSPLIQAGTVYHPPPGWLDHTSIIKTLTTRWNRPSLGLRDAAAQDLSALLTLDEPRTDLPLILNWDVAPDPRSADDVPADDLHRDFVQLVAHARGLTPPAPPRTMADVMAFLRSVPREKRR
jgi:phospholipase C